MALALLGIERIGKRFVGHLRESSFAVMPDIGRIP